MSTAPDNVIPFGSQMAPHSIEAEEGALGSCAINPNAYHELATFLTADDFFLLRNSWVWEAMTAIVERKEDIDYVSLVAELDRRGRLNDIGGAAYIIYLIGNTPTSMNAVTYGRIVQRAALRRRLLEAAEEINTIARNEELAIDEVVEKSSKVLMSVVQRKNENGWTPLKEVAIGVFNRVEARYQGKEDAPGISTGLPLDRFFKLKRAKYYVLVGRPGMGKTDALLNIMVNVARQGKRVGFFSLEMDKDEVVYRVLSRFAKIDSQRLEDEQLTPDEWQRFVDAYTEFNKLPIFIDDEPSQTPMTMLARARVLAAQRGLDVVFMDYLQLASSGERTMNETDEVSKISRGCNQLKKDLNVSVFVAAQLNRALENRTDKRPMMSDIRQSGQIEQDANVILYVYRDEEYNKDSADAGTMEFGILKNRGGKKWIGEGESKTNKAMCHYNPEHHFIGSLAKQWQQQIAAPKRPSNLDRARNLGGVHAVPTL